LVWRYSVFEAIFLSTMKISTSTIKTLIPTLELTPQQLADVLTMHAFETVIDREYVIDPNIRVVKILKIEPHPNADRLRLVTITDGTQEIRVVCGAPNIEEGHFVPYAPPGAKVYDENREFFTLTEAVIRGEKSPGMLNSMRELGLSEDHGGILILPPETPLGTKLVDYIPSDTILDVDVLPDRARDVVSHIRIAKEISALTQDALHTVTQPILHTLLERILGIAPWGDAHHASRESRTIDFHPERPTKVAGIGIDRGKVRNILERLGFAVDDTLGNIWNITVPSERVDVHGEHDLVDEVVRLHGLDSIPPSSIVDTFVPKPVSERVFWMNLIRRELVEAGFSETYSYSFEDERIGKMIGVERHPHVELINPMAPELKKLRYSMLPGLIGAMMKSRDEMHRERKGQERALFEIGRVYHVGDGGQVPGVIERPVVSGIAVGGSALLQDTLDRIRTLFQLETADVIELPESKAFASVKRLQYAGEFLGIIYVFNQELLKKMKFRLPVVAFELSFNALIKHAPEVEIPVKTLESIRTDIQTPTQFEELPKYPSVFRDISMLVDPSVSVEQVEETIERIGKGRVVDVDLFDEFEGVGTGKKSLAFHIEYRSSEKTLTDAEILEVHQTIEHALKKDLGAEIR
jgi:tRNA-binding EMAP/Myf-like protein